MSTTVHMKGLADLNKFLQELPVKVERNLLRGALRAGAKVVEADVLRKVPVGLPSAENQRLYGSFTGALKASVRVTTKVKRGVVTASVKAGSDQAWYWRFVEYGTAAHWIGAAKGGALQFGGAYHMRVMHPGAQPKPFMRPALDGQASAAVAAAAEYMKRRLASKHGIDTSDVQIGPT